MTRIHKESKCREEESLNQSGHHWSFSSTSGHSDLLYLQIEQILVELWIERGQVVNVDIHALLAQEFGQEETRHREFAEVVFIESLKDKKDVIQ